MITLTFTDEQACALDSFAGFFKIIESRPALSNAAKAWLAARASAETAALAPTEAQDARTAAKRLATRTPAQVEAARNLRPGYKRKRKLDGQTPFITQMLADGLSGPGIARYFEVSVTTLYHSPEWKSAQEAAGVVRDDNFNEIK